MTQSIFHEFVDHQRNRAHGYLAGFLADHPECRLDDTPWIKGDHLVAFGSYENSPAVYKFYDGDPQKQHEKNALDLYKPTGLVPAVFADTDSLIVMEMTRMGNEPLMLGTVFAELHDKPGAWEEFKTAYRTARNEDDNEFAFHMARVTATFSQWIRCTWYLSTDDQPWWAKELELGNTTVKSIAELEERIQKKE